MGEKQNFSFHIEAGEDYKSRRLIYEEPGYKLIIYIEMSGVGQFDWVACDTELLKWTLPEGVLIPEEKKLEILSRLNDWCKKKKIRIEIGPPLEMKKIFSTYEKKGYKVEKFTDGSTKIFFHQKSIGWESVFQIIIALFIGSLIVVILIVILILIIRVFNQSIKLSKL